MQKTVLISAPKYYGIDTDIKDAFELLGVNAYLINNIPHAIYERIGIKITNNIPVLNNKFNSIQKLNLIKENDNLLSMVSKVKPDLLFIIKGDYIFPETFKMINKTASIPVVGYAWDKPFYSIDDNMDDYRKSNFKNGISLYDFLYVFDTSYIDEMKSHGAKNVNYMPLATNPGRFRNIFVTDEERRKYGYDVCFIGLPFENRIEMIESLRNYNLGIFGDQWRKHFILKGKSTPSYYRGRASGDIAIKIYLSSKIVLNIHHLQSIEGLNTRTFDIPACGAFEMVDHKNIIERHFKLNDEIVTFNDRNELKYIIKYYINNDDLRKNIIARGKQRVLNEHTWVHRIKDNLMRLF